MSRQLSFNTKKEFELIEYPGRVVNTDRMLTTLGGIVNISKVRTASTYFYIVFQHSVSCRFSVMKSVAWSCISIRIIPLTSPPLAIVQTKEAYCCR